jgi:hypothetical protein
LDTKTLDLYYGDKYQVTASPSSGRSSIQWASEDPSVATVSADGLIEAVNVGVTNVTATLESGKTTLPVTVTVPTVDNVIGHPGNRRAALELIISNDRIKTIKITRLDNNVSQETDMNYQSGNITVSYIGLAEGRYPFRVVCIDKYGNESVPFDIYIQVYGDVYQSTLIDREYKVMSKFGNGLTVSWNNQTGSYIEFFYNNEAGQAVSKIVPVTAYSAHVDDFGSGPISYNTLYLPESTAVDTFRIGPVNYTGTLTDYTTYVRSFPVVTLVKPGDFDLGGEGVGYHDASIAHNGSGGVNYRPDRGDTQSDPCDVEGTGGNVGSIDAGEWIAYTVTVVDEGDYEIDWYISVNATAGASCHIEIDGVSSEVYQMPNQGNWSAWRYHCEANSVAAPLYHLTAGKHRLVFFANTSGFNYNGMRITFK